MNEKILPLASPPIKLYLNHAYILSALLSDKRGLPWFYSNYIQIIFNKNVEESQNFSMDFFLGHGTKYFYNLPVLDVSCINKKFFLKKNGDIIKYIIENIDENYYINTITDEFYIPDREVFSQTHYMHLIQIFGYNCEKKIFYINGFNKKLEYEKSSVSFSDFEKAFKSIKGDTDKIRDHYIMMYKISNINERSFPQNNYNYFDYPFDIKHVKESITEYLYAINSSEKFRLFYTPLDITKVGFGIEIYKYLKQYLNKQINIQHLDSIDFRVLHGLVEHKKCMLDRIIFMSENNYLEDSLILKNMYDDILKKSIIVRNLILKFNFHHNKKYIEKSISFISEIEKIEFDSLTLFLNKLNV